jgi:2-keto-4-pentenoate hydratase/2-oxohepta-3-ene-1,7-dioic acid hydratase in catechol pathway
MKIICVGRNYQDHAKELGNAVPEQPVLFMKSKNALHQTTLPFYYPAFTNELHYEIELVVKISKNGKYISRAAAPDYYNAITVGIDFTARDIQDELKAKGLPWEKSKAFDNSASVGTFISSGLVDTKRNLNFSLLKNQEKVQNGFSKDMLFGIDEIIEHASEYFTLNIGDLIFTGTPAGVGECTIGDTLEGYLEKQKLLSVTIK